MRKYQESGKLETVICNGCGKKLVVEGRIFRELSLGLFFGKRWGGSPLGSVRGVL